MKLVITQSIKTISAIAICLFFNHYLLSQKKAINTNQDSINVLKIKPSLTDNSITKVDVPHLILYNPTIPQGKLLLFLPGTNGIPERGPKKLFETAVEKGYRVINLSYINTPAVAQICRGENLENDSDCAEKFRIQRIYGTQLIPFIPDEPQDAIISRFTKLLQYLNKTDENGNWGLYLKNNKPNWKFITVSGQSQGGGMAAYIAKKTVVNRIITFSGGWDFSEKNEIAKWYTNKSKTPVNRWFGTYHIKEPRAVTISETYKAMEIPENHIYALSLKIREGKKAHGEAIRNTLYKDMWKKIFDDAKLIAPK